VGHVADLQKLRSAYRFFFFAVKPEGKKLFGRRRYRWKENINVTIIKILDSIRLAE
jgi:hypothetical protein